MLFSSSAKLQVVLGAAVTTNPVTVVASWADIAANASTLAPDSATTSVSTTSPVDVIGSPSAGQRQVKFVTIFNDDTVDHTVTVRLSDSTNLRKLLSVDVEAGGRIEFTPNGWRVFDATGAEVGSGGGGGGGSTAWGDLTGIPANVTAVANGEGAVPPIGYGASLLETDEIVTIDGATYLKSNAYAETADYPDAPVSLPTTFFTAKTYSGTNITSAVQAIEVSGGTLFLGVNSTADAYLVDSSGNSTFVASLTGATTWLNYAKIGSSIIVLFGPSAGTTYWYSGDGGVTWSSKTTPTSSVGLKAVSNGTTIVLVPSNSSSTAYYSTDGINWTSTSMPSAANWSACDYGRGLFVAASSAAGTVAAYSADGITWTSSTKPSSTIGNCLYMFGKFYMFGTSSSSTVYTTTNGIAWSTESLSTAVTFGRGVYDASRSAAFITQASSANCWESFDGTSWITCSGKAATTNIPFAYGVVYSGTNMKRLPLYSVVGFPNAVDYLYMRVA